MKLLDFGVDDERKPSYEELAALVVEQAETMSQLRGEVLELRARVAELVRAVGQNSGNSGKPPSLDSAAERQRQAEECKIRASCRRYRRHRRAPR